MLTCQCQEQKDNKTSRFHHKTHQSMYFSISDNFHDHFNNFEMFILILFLLARSWALGPLCPVWTGECTIGLVVTSQRATGLTPCALVMTLLTLLSSVRLNYAG